MAGIAVGNVHAANVARQSVDDDNLAVVAVVGLAGERRETHGQERLYLDAGLAHALIEAVVHAPAAHVVEDDAHLNALSGLVDERIADETAQGVVFEDIDVDVDVVACLRNVAQQPDEEIVAAGQ